LSSSSHHHKSSSRDKESYKERERDRREREEERKKREKEKRAKEEEEREEEMKRREKEEAEREEEVRKKMLSEKVAKAEKVLSEFQESLQKNQLSSLLPHEEEEEDDGVRTPPPPHLPLPSILSEDKTSPKNDEVSSTVVIKTPERSSFDATKGENPNVWGGVVDMPDVAKFSVTAQAVSGNTDYLTIDLRESLKIVGRIPPATIWEYLTQVAEMATKEVLLVRLQPATDEESANYSSFFTYLQSRKRFGVVGNTSKNVKDCYIMPLGNKDKLHKCL
jgi:flagellar biosynthesis GTPase FlhF